MNPLGLVLIAAVLGAAPNNDEPAKDDAAKFEGVWSFAQVEVNGQKQPAMPYPANEIIALKDGRFVVVQGEKVTFGKATLNPGASPKAIDISIVQGPAKGRKTAAIYELSETTYRFCGLLSGSARPTAFASAGAIVHTMKREKQLAKDALTELYRKDLAGTWQATSFEREGATASDDELKGIQLIIDKEGGTKSLIGGKVFLAGPATIDPTQDPMCLDVSYTEGVNKGKSSVGIFSLEDGVLTICRRPPGKPRPTEFSSKPDSAMILIKYRREPAALPK